MFISVDLKICKSFYIAMVMAEKSKEDFAYLNTPRIRFCFESTGIFLHLFQLMKNVEILEIFDIL